MCMVLTLKINVFDRLVGLVPDLYEDKDVLYNRLYQFCRLYYSEPKDLSFEHKQEGNSNLIISPFLIGLS